MTTFLEDIAKSRGARALRALAVVALTASLGGCYTQRIADESYPNDYRERHPITLKEREHTVQIFVGRNRGGLTPPQRADVLAFAQLWRRESTSGVIIDVPKGGPTDHAAADSLREIHSILTASGVPRNAVYMRTYRPPSDALASIKINYSKMVAEAGPCGLWPHDLGPSLDATYVENRSYWNLGCASQRNLAAMVDNPSDLVQPRGEAPSYTARRSTAIDKYRKGENPSAAYSGYDNGKISDLGK
ncbi:MAG TPA: CpaD family pilus assembly protein [Pseudolabrys sp.]|nr:CpaD family pilus assembly protein [Pseudolabrys sp.]